MSKRMKKKKLLIFNNKYNGYINQQISLYIIEQYNLINRVQISGRYLKKSI